MELMVTKSPVRLYASPKAVITRFLSFNHKRVDHVVKRIQALDEKEVCIYYGEVLKNFAGRHRNINQTFIDHFNRINEQYDNNPLQFSETKRLLLGALFSMEYSIKTAALFNPSIVPHPNQQGLQEGEQRFIMSLRATGEGHISSIVFQTGLVNNKGTIVLDKEPEFFTRLKINTAIENNDSNYELESSAHLPMNEKVIFPTLRSESMGMEDIRFVLFKDGDSSCYYGTYTAYDGQQIKTQLIETTDFDVFKIRNLSGAAISDKGMALFPEKVNGKYAMISRQGGEMINIMFSEDLYTWEHFQLLMEPLHIWEFVQLGNCGSPVKTSKGWLLLTHGVGPMRTYVISAILLDLKDPTKIIGRLNKPILCADEFEREGYVPNVVYTCGYLLHDDLLLIPYAVSDSATGFATILLDDILTEMKS